MITNEWMQNGEDCFWAYKIRKEVFIDEQNCPIDIERDKYDKTMIHLLVYEDKTPIGCGRILNMGDYYKFSRIAVLKQHRGKHFGDLIVRLMLYKSFNMGACEIRISAQINVVPFYEKFGFEAYGETFIEAGISHKMMRVFVETAKYPSSCG